MRRKDITGVFDLDTSTVSGVTKNFLSRKEKENKISGINILPKSFILDCGGKIYFSANMSRHIAGNAPDRSVSINFRKKTGG
jgi:hypothetical protein